MYLHHDLKISCKLALDSRITGKHTAFPPLHLPPSLTLKGSNESKVCASILTLWDGRTRRGETGKTARRERNGTSF